MELAKSSFEKLIEIWSKDKLYKLYVEDNNSITDCCKQLSVSQSTFMKLLKYYGIKKPKEAHIRNIKKSKLERYGDPNFNNRAKATKTNLERYGVENQFQRKDLFPQIAKIKIERYGSYNNIEKNHETRAMRFGSVEASYKQQANIRKQTCLNKYGVDNAAKVDSIKKQIAKSLRETFLKKYGVENYWCLPDAKLPHNSIDSKPNRDFAVLLNEAKISFEREFLIENRRYDFKVENYLIEINPTPTHNSTYSLYASNTGLAIDYHSKKSELAKAYGFTCIHVFDWDDKKKIVERLKIRKILYARKCRVKEIDLKTTVSFLESFHLQGYAKDKIRLGLFYDENLVSVMTFGKPRFNTKYEYELIRYCSPNFNIVGGAAKLFSYFINKYKPNTIVSYCDLSKFTGDLYSHLGFKQIRKNKASRHWYNMKTKQHITENLLRQRGFDQLFNTNYGKGTSNEILMLNAGFVEIYDCGQATYGWEQKKAKTE